MDRMMLKAAIQKIEQEREIHDKKFAGNDVHKDCLPRFDKVLTNLKSDLQKEEAQNPAQS
jgi:hypothetical protein